MKYLLILAPVSRSHCHQQLKRKEQTEYRPYEHQFSPRKDKGTASNQIVHNGKIKTAKIYHPYKYYEEVNGTTSTNMLHIEIHIHLYAIHSQYMHLKHFLCEADHSLLKFTSKRKVS